MHTFLLSFSGAPFSLSSSPRPSRSFICLINVRLSIPSHVPHIYARGRREQIKQNGLLFLQGLIKQEAEQVWDSSSNNTCPESLIPNP